VDRFEIGFDAAWNEAEAGLDPFNFVVPPEFSTLNPVQSFDFGQVSGYSNLDTSRIEIGTDARFRFTERFWLFGGYRYLEYEDDEPVLVDSDGSVDLYQLGLGWTF
jgi:hypothetical protein